MTEPCMFPNLQEPFYCRIHADVRLRLTDERCRRGVTLTQPQPDPDVFCTRCGDDHRLVHEPGGFDDCKLCGHVYDDHQPLTQPQPDAGSLLAQCPGCWAIHRLPTTADYECDCGERVVMLDLRSDEDKALDDRIADALRSIPAAPEEDDGE